MYFHIFRIVFFKHYYYSTTANSSCSAGRLQEQSAQINWHAGSMRKPCEQVGVFVQVCTQANSNLSKAENIPLLLLAAPPLNTSATSAVSVLPPLQD